MVRKNLQEQIVLVEAYQMSQQAFKEDAMSRTQGFEWLERFECNEISVKDHAHSGHLSSFQNEKNVKKNRQ